MKKSLYLILLVVILMSCEKNELVQKIDNNNISNIVFDYNFQVFETDKHNIMIKGYPKVYEVYIKPGKVATHNNIKVNFSIDNPNLKSQYVVFKWFDKKPEVATFLTPSVGTRFGDISEINEEDLVDNKVFVAVMVEGLGTGVSNLTFESTWDNVVKKVSKQVQIAL